MKTNNKKKIIVLLVLYLTILLSPKVKGSEKNIDIIYESNYEYINYEDKRIVIINRGNLNYLFDKKENDVYILDCRCDGNSNFEIIDSYKITDKVEMENILNILLTYEKENPSSWNRSKESMLNEWMIHNICYYLGYDINSTEHVDFDNEDEDKYSSKELSRLLGN